MVRSDFSFSIKSTKLEEKRTFFRRMIHLTVLLKPENYMPRTSLSLGPGEEVVGRSR